jgi:hypothetical protein
MTNNAAKYLPKIFKVTGNFFSSLKLAIGLFTAIAAIGAIGLFFPSFLFSLFIPTILLFINLLFCIGRRLVPRLAGNKINLQKAGIVLIHLSIALILLAIAVGYFRGWSTSLQIAEGETISLPDKIKNVSEPLSISCRRFIIDYYQDGKPKDFRAELIFQSGSNSPVAVASVNNPVNFHGINFYLMSYGNVSGKAILTISKQGKLIREADVSGQSELNTDGLQINILRLEDDINGFGPAVKIRVTGNGKSADLWILQNIMQMQKRYPQMLKEMPPLNPAQLKPYLFSFNLEKGKTYIVLDVKSDPGVPLAAAGAFLLLAGILLVVIAQSSKKHNQLTAGSKDAGGVFHG